MAELLLSRFPELHSIGRYPLRHPVNAEVSFSEEDQIWVVESKDLGVVGCGSSAAEIVASLEDHFDCCVFGFLMYVESEISASSLVQRRKMEEFVDFDVVSKIFVLKCGCC